MTKANANMGDPQESAKKNSAQQKRSVTTKPGRSAGPPRMINKGEGLTNSGSPQG